jgi:hypothetical protein
MPANIKNNNRQFPGIKNPQPLLTWEIAVMVPLTDTAAWLPTIGD